MGIGVRARLLSRWDVHSESQEEEVRASLFLDARRGQSPFRTGQLLLGVKEMHVSSE